MVRRANPFPVPPPQVGGGSFTFSPLQCQIGAETIVKSCVVNPVESPGVRCPQHVATHRPKHPIGPLLMH
jgi:hypothetical protein